MKIHFCVWSKCQRKYGAPRRIYVVFRRGTLIIALTPDAKVRRRMYGQGWGWVGWHSTHDLLHGR